MPQAKKKNKSKYLIGAGVTAAVAAGVVGFLTQTKKGKALTKQGQKEIAVITKKIAKKADEVKRLSKEKYEEIVDDVVAEYEKKKKLTKAAGVELANELKKEWNEVKKELKK